MLYVVGFVTLGASFQEHLSIGALVMGWGISGVAVMINTVSMCKHPIAFTPLANNNSPGDLQTHTATTASRGTKERFQG